MLHERRCVHQRTRIPAGVLNSRRRPVKSVHGELVEPRTDRPSTSSGPAGFGATKSPGVPSRRSPLRHHPAGHFLAQTGILLTAGLGTCRPLAEGTPPLSAQFLHFSPKPYAKPTRNINIIIIECADTRSWPSTHNPFHPSSLFLKASLCGFRCCTPLANSFRNHAKGIPSANGYIVCEHKLYLTQGYSEHPNLQEVLIWRPLRQG